MTRQRNGHEIGYRSAGPVLRWAGPPGALIRRGLVLRPDWEAMPGERVT